MMANEKTCQTCVMYQDGYCNRDGMHADKTKPSYSCRWWIGGMRNDKKGYADGRSSKIH